MATIAQQWIEQGIVQNARESVIDILQIRFGTIPSDVTETITAINDSLQLKALRKPALVVNSLAEFGQALAA